MGFYGQNDKTVKEESSKGEFFGASVRLELQSMKAQIHHFVSARMSEELEPAINNAVEKALDGNWWRSELESQVQNSIKDAIKNAVDSAIKNNWDLREHLENSIKKHAHELIKQSVGSMVTKVKKNE